jgi:hypothetical protein
VNIEWVLGFLAVAFGVVFLSYIFSYRWVGAKLYDRVGAGDWKVTESWASTLTALGGILGTILTAQVLPSETVTQKDTSGSFGVFKLMFAVLVVVATALYNTLRIQKKVVKPAEEPLRPGETPKVEPPAKTETPTVFEYQGFVVFFLVTSALVLWAVLGQLLTAWHLLDKVPNTSLSASIHTVFQFSLVSAGILALVYGATSVPWTLRNQAYRDEIGRGSQNQQQPRTRPRWYLI